MQFLDSQQVTASVFAPFELCRYTLPHSRNVYDVVGELAQRWTPVLAVNFKKAGVQLRPGMEADSDLYRDAPESVRREHSLHLIGPEDNEAWLEVFEEFRSRGTLIVIFTDKSRGELVDGLRLYLAWYAQPGTLKIQLEEGSAHLTKGIMTFVKAILLHAISGDDGIIYLPPDVELPAGCSILEKPK